MTTQPPNHFVNRPPPNYTSLGPLLLKLRKVLVGKLYLLSLRLLPLRGGKLVELKIRHDHVPDTYATLVVARLLGFQYWLRNLSGLEGDGPEVWQAYGASSLADYEKDYTYLVICLRDLRDEHGDQIPVRGAFMLYSRTELRHAAHEAGRQYLNRLG